MVGTDNIRTSVIGFPRIGAMRELKFASERYFRGEIEQHELLKVGSAQFKSNISVQQNARIDLIPSNDFSFYDGLLDTANMLNIIPGRYRDLRLSELDTYFAQCRGYQGDKGDVRALAMKKWFNTNYHYMVPEIDDHTSIRLTGHKPFDMYKEAKGWGIETKPVIIGPLTLLRLCRFTGRRGMEQFIDDTVRAYQDVLNRVNSMGVAWLQLDEPCLVFDLSEGDIALFEQLYSQILQRRSSCRILLQTYFGDIRDIYQSVMQQDFDAVGLDFVEGRQSLELIRQHGFPADKLLVAGVVNGKNIWRNHYQQTLKLIEELRTMAPQLMLSTSCSLLHVPYTLDNEEQLDERYKRHFAFAYEKLRELHELRQIATQRDQSPLERNRALFSGDRHAASPEVQKRVKAITAEDTVRKPDFAERERLQHEAFRLPLFPTTTIGSFPQVREVKLNRSSFKKGEISSEQYNEFNRKAIAECVHHQENIGLDVLVHGEFERNDMVEYFGELLDGVLFTSRGWVQSYGTRGVKPPIIWGDISRPRPMTVDWITYAQSQTKRPLKGMLTGPVTILNWSFPREDIPLRDCAYQLALAIADEVHDLEQAGIRIIQVDEAALREKLPLRRSDWQSEYLDWAIPAFRLVHSKCQAGTQIHTHMCYSEFNDIIEAIDAMDADVITFEAARSDLQLLDALQESHFRTEVGPGVYDIHSPRVPAVREITDALHKIVRKVEPRKVWVNPDCGLKTRGNSETWQSLSNMVKAAQELRSEFEGRL